MNRYERYIIAIVFVVFLVGLFKVSYNPAQSVSETPEEKMALAGKATEGILDKLSTLDVKEVDCFDGDSLTENSGSIASTVLINDDGITQKKSDVCISDNMLEETTCTTAGFGIKLVNCKDSGLSCLRDEKGRGYCG